MQASILSNYVSTLQSMSISGWDTLQILDRQARKDTGKVIRFSVKVGQFLTSKDAIKTYESIGRLIVIAGTVAIALGMSAADLCHGFIQSCYEVETNVEATVEATTVSKVPVVEDATTKPISRNELRVIAKELCIPRFNRLTKAELEQAIALVVAMHLSLKPLADKRSTTGELALIAS